VLRCISPGLDELNIYNSNNVALILCGGVVSYVNINSQEKLISIHISFSIKTEKNGL